MWKNKIKDSDLKNHLIEQFSMLFRFQFLKKSNLTGQIPTLDGFKGAIQKCAYFD